MDRPSVVKFPPPTTERPRSRARRDAAAAGFRRRVDVIDRIARLLISISGLGIICAVLGIGFFLVVEVLPLFQGARIRPGLSQPVLPRGQQAHLVLADEHQERAMALGDDPLLRVVSLALAAPPEFIPLEGLAGHQVSAVSRLPGGSSIAVGTTRGVIWIGRIGFQTVFDGERRTVRTVVEPDTLLEAVPGHRISRLTYRDAGTRSVAASLVKEGKVIVTRITTQGPLIGPVRRGQDSIPVPMDRVGRPVEVLLDETGAQLFVGTANGLLARWQLPAEGPATLIETVPVVPGGAVSALAPVLGGRSVIIGGDDGSVATWSLVRDESAADGRRLTRIHTFRSHPAAITVMTPSSRDKGFITTSADGSVRLHYMTSERTLAQLTVRPAAAAGAFAPKANGAVLVDEAGALHHWLIDNPHPEVSWQVLFGKVWYEGYPRPDYVWQSTGGSDDFESKFSLVPLVFGTLKGTCYALLLAVPLALFGALYCSQFLDQRLRNPIKSTIELMAALPSVVLGFVTGVMLAPLVQGHIVSVLSAPILIPLVSLGGVWGCRLIPAPALQAWVRRREFWVLTCWAGVGLLAAAWAGPWIERFAFGGDFETWLLQATGIRYDQRNSLVVGWAMGFAVIPIIFTICEDAFSAVPKHLVGASLACGASAWQTAWRVVLPAAGSGVFSAVMVGFGRAVGETMIVLMATGNTPIMDWAIFNGFRALSANIAVEIPEAPYQGTLYRVLFVAALLLFAMTFVVNTAAELVRLRLRKQLQGI